MEAYRLDKIIENEKIDLILAKDKIKNLKDQLSKSLARRKEIAISMNETQYSEKKIDNLCLENDTQETNEVVKDLLGKNSLLQEEVKKLKRDMELLAVKSYGNSDQEDQTILSKNLMEKEIRTLKEKLEEKDNEVSQLSIHQANLSRQLSDAHQTIHLLKEENEKHGQEQSINQFENEQKGRAGLGYQEQNDSSKLGNKKATKPTCTHYGKLGHTTNKCWSNG